MEMLKKFFRCYFTQSEGFEDLERIIQDFKGHPSEHQLIADLHQIMRTKNYELASQIIDKYGDRILSLEKTEKLINFLYDRFIDRPTNVKAEDFAKKIKGIFCPVCCPNPKTATFFSLIEKATIKATGVQIYICKPCKLAWLTEDIRTDNAQDYKKLMKSLGLKGLWKELSNVDVL